MSELIQSDLVTFLGERLPGYVPRISQQQMTELVAEAIRTRQNAMVEAGTGTGKSIAYLLPALSSGLKVIVSTGTKNLQDQLFMQDLPIINEVLGKSIALLKGRANYVCLERLHKHIDQISAQNNSALLEKLIVTYDWAARTRSGDLTEILDDNELATLRSLVTSTADNCLGQNCGSFDKCFLYRARQQALQADIVIVNHHLLFADLALKEEDHGELLPQADVIILDEAHQIEEIARIFYGQSISSGQVFELARDIVSEQKLIGQDDPELFRTVEALELAMTKMVESINATDKLSVATVRGWSVIEEVDIAIADVIGRLGLSAGRSAGLDKCYARACRLSDLFALMTEPTSDLESAHYIEKRPKGFTIHLSPLDIGQYLAPLFSDENKVWLLVSATLSTTANHETSDEEKAFRHIAKAIGYSGGLTGRFTSPFRFRDQVAGFVPELPDPRDETHNDKLMSAVLPLIRSNQGRNLLLFTSHKALRAAANRLRQEHDLPILQQGALAKSKLIEKFYATEKAVLLATHSFWEGVDLKGSDLRLLVIDKLPFVSPDDPVFQAKMNLLDVSGGNSFADLSLPRAAVMLKQGFGRLIRQETDVGLFVLGDPRIDQKSYGKVLKNCLPSINWLSDTRAAIDYLEKLNGHTGN